MVTSADRMADSGTLPRASEPPPATSALVGPPQRVCRIAAASAPKVAVTRPPATSRSTPGDAEGTRSVQAGAPSRVSAASATARRSKEPPPSIPRPWTGVPSARPRLARSLAAGTQAGASASREASPVAGGVTGTGPARPHASSGPQTAASGAPARSIGTVPVSRISYSASTTRRRTVLPRGDRPVSRWLACPGPRCSASVERTVPAKPPLESMPPPDRSIVRRPFSTSLKRSVAAGRSFATSESSGPGQRVAKRSGVEPVKLPTPGPIRTLCPVDWAAKPPNGPTTASAHAVPAAVRCVRDVVPALLPVRSPPPSVTVTNSTRRRLERSRIAETDPRAWGRHMAEPETSQRLRSAQPAAGSPWKSTAMAPVVVSCAAACAVMPVPSLPKPTRSSARAGAAAAHAASAAASAALRSPPTARNPELRAQHCQLDMPRLRFLYCCQTLFLSRRYEDMALVRWEPVRELNSLQSEMNRLFNTFFDTPTTAGNGNGLRRWVPPMDLVETDEHFVLKADLPGLDAGDVNIEVEDTALTVSGERKVEHETSKEGFYRLERASGEFRRSLTLPEGVDADKIVAAFDRGVLEVRTPKPEQRKPRKVQIALGDQQPAIEA